MKRILFSFVIALSIMMSSCASIFTSSSSEVRINSDPRDAKVQIINRKGKQIYEGRTPATITLNHSSSFFKRAEYTVKFSLEGYEPREITLHTTVQGWYWGNLLIGGVLGMLIIDPATGAMYKLETHDISEALTKSASASTDGSPALKIMTLQSVPQNMRQHLVKL
jgi:hypothetical protein